MNNREKIEKLLKLQKSYGDKFSNYLIEEEDENSRDEKRAYRKGYIEGCLNTFLDIFDIIPFNTMDYPEDIINDIYYEITRYLKDSNFCSFIKEEGTKEENEFLKTFIFIPLI